MPAHILQHGEARLPCKGVFSPVAMPYRNLLRQAEQGQGSREQHLVVM